MLMPQRTIVQRCVGALTLLTHHTRMLMPQRTIVQRCVGALTLLTVSYTLFSILWPIKWSLLLTWLGVEVIFYITYYIPRYESLNTQPVVHEPSNPEAMKKFDRFLAYCKDMPNGLDYHAYLDGWFRGAAIQDIKRGNVEELMAYGFWYKTRQQMADMGLGEVPGQMVDQLQAVWGVRLQPGYNPDITFMGHLWEDLAAVWHPLAFYLLTEGLGWGGRQLLRRWGFMRHRHNGLSYFTLHLAKQKPAPFSGGGDNSSSSLGGDDSLSALGSHPPGASRIETFHDLAVAAGLQELSGEVQSPPHTAITPLKSVGQQQHGTGRAAAAGASSCQQPLQVEASVGGGDEEWTPFADNSGPCTTTSSQELGPALQPATAPTTAPTVEGALVSADLGCGSSGSHPGSGTSPSATSSSAATSDSKLRPNGAVSAPMPHMAIEDSIQPSDSQHQQEQSQQWQQRQQVLRLRAVSLPRLAPATSQLLLASRPTQPLAMALSQALTDAGVSSAGDVPVLFLHGVGGLPAYLELVLQLVALGSPLIAVDFKGVSMRLGRVYTPTEVADTVVGVLDSLGVQQVCVVAHSYGTFIAGLLARHHPHRVAAMCLIDAVCFGMFMPYLLTNFLYKKLTWTGWNIASLNACAKAAARKLLAQELHMSASFARRFYWSDLNLWPEDLPPGSVVLLSGKDDLMDSEEVKNMLEAAGHVKVVYNSDLTHGAFLLNSEVKAAVLDDMRELLGRSGRAVVGLAAQGLSTLVAAAHHGHSQAVSSGTDRRADRKGKKE